MEGGHIIKPNFFFLLNKGGYFIFEMTCLFFSFLLLFYHYKLNGCLSIDEIFFLFHNMYIDSSSSSWDVFIGLVKFCGLRVDMLVREEFASLYLLSILINSYPKSNTLLLLPPPTIPAC
jgi:hypothetical protein